MDILRFYEGRLSEEQRKVERKDKRTSKYSSKSDLGTGGLEVRIPYIENILKIEILVGS